MNFKCLPLTFAKCTSYIIRFNIYNLRNKKYIFVLVFEKLPQNEKKVNL